MLPGLRRNDPHASGTDGGIRDLPVADNMGLNAARFDVRRRVYQEYAVAYLFPERRGRSLHYFFAFVQHHHIMTAFGFIQIGCRQQHADALLFDETVDDLPQLAARNRIDPDSRFIQQQHLRRFDQGAHQPQLLLHAARKRARHSFGETGQVGHLEQLGIAVPALGWRDALQVRVQIHVFRYREVLIQAELLGHVADAALNFDRVAHAVQP